MAEQSGGTVAPACATCQDRGTVYVRIGANEWEPEDCPDCPPDRPQSGRCKGCGRPCELSDTEYGGCIDGYHGNCEPTPQSPRDVS